MPWVKDWEWNKTHEHRVSSKEKWILSRCKMISKTDTPKDEIKANQEMEVKGRWWENEMNKIETSHNEMKDPQFLLK